MLVAAQVAPQADINDLISVAMFVTGGISEFVASVMSMREYLSQQQSYDLDAPLPQTFTLISGGDEEGIVNDEDGGDD
jgi:hypothetical protein